jgi:hypothetical protein
MTTHYEESRRRRTWQEVCDILGPEALAATERLAAEAPPLSPGVYAELAVILRRDSPDSAV